MIYAFTTAPVGVQLAVQLLAEIANDDADRRQERARDVLDGWRECLATPTQACAVAQSEDLQVDEGACVSEGEGGFWVQCWAWVASSDEEGNVDA